MKLREILYNNQHNHFCDACEHWTLHIRGRKYWTCLTCNTRSLRMQPCGHPISAIVHNGTTAYCGQCADDSLRENINNGIEA